MKSFQRGVASFRTARVPELCEDRRVVVPGLSAQLMNSVSTEYGSSVWMSCSLTCCGCLVDLDTKSESVPCTWKFIGVSILVVKFSAPIKLQCIEPPTSIVWISPSVLSTYASSKRFLAPDGMIGQKVAKIAILPLFVSKKNPVAGTPPSGSMLLET